MFQRNSSFLCSGVFLAASYSCFVAAELYVGYGTAYQRRHQREDVPTDEIAFGLYSRMTTTRQLHAEQRCRVDDDDQVMSCVSAVVLHRGFIRTYITRGAHERDVSADVTTGVNVLQDLGTDRDSADCEHAQQISS